ncbi:MAG: hypothetical protein ACRD0H_29840, partial [Actinomycetes bacterium]
AAAKDDAEARRGELAEARTELAGTAAQLAGAREQVTREIAHAGDRVADQRERTEAAAQEAARLRTQLDEQRTRHAAELEALRRTDPTTGRAGPPQKD